ncbi:MAG: hypothetical protein ACSHX9_11845 [Luteolibacter sp.]
MSFGESVNKACKTLLLGVVFFVAGVTAILAFKFEPWQRKIVGERALRIVYDMRDLKLDESLVADDGLAGDPSVEMLTQSNPGEETYDNFGAAWPKAARPPFNPRHEVISEDPAKNVYVYESPGYRFYSDEPIAHGASMHFATLFETTREFIKTLPIGMVKTGEGSKKSKVLMFGKDAAYYKAGGPKWSAGCYFPMKRLVLVPTSSLQLQKTEGGFDRDERKDHKVLIHELVHQLTPAAYYAHGSVGWFTEGLAEYIGTTPYHPGYFWVDPHGDTVFEYVTAYGQKNMGGRALGTYLQLPPLKDFMLMSYDRFSGKEGNLNYGASLAIVYYFFHMEGGGGARRITAFLKGLKSGVFGEEALELLHGGQGFATLEADIARAWKRKGLTISFGGR